LLSTLAQLETAVTVRALARHAGVSAQGALRVVNQLQDSGIVEVEPAGSALMVALNREHLAVEPLAALVRTRGRLIGRLAEELENWSGLAGAWLFGSTARGDGGHQSDVDLLLVSSSGVDDDGWAEASTQLRYRVRRLTGNEAHLTEYSRRDFARLVRERSPLVLFTPRAPPPTPYVASLSGNAPPAQVTRRRWNYWLVSIASWRTR